LLPGRKNANPNFRGADVRGDTPQPFDAFGCIVVTRSAQGWACIAFNRPERLNRLSIQLRQELAQAVRQLEADRDVHVLILTGCGTVFTAGLDLDEWDAPEGPVAAGYVHDAVAALHQFGGPIIAAVNGVAVTGGVEIALACDVIIASEQARFADTHVRVGLLPGWGGSARLIQRVGLLRAKELALTGKFFTAQQAAQWGFVNHVVEHARLMDEAQAMAVQMLKTRPEDLVRYKQLLDQQAAMTFADALRWGRQRSVETNTTVARTEMHRRLRTLVEESQ